jgi:hypothetical protein
MRGLQTARFLESGDEVRVAGTKLRGRTIEVLAGACRWRTRRPTPWPRVEPQTHRKLVRLEVAVATSRRTQLPVDDEDTDAEGEGGPPVQDR